MAEEKGGQEVEEKEKNEKWKECAFFISRSKYSWNKELLLNVSMSGQRNVITLFQNHPGISVCVRVCVSARAQIKRETFSLKRRCNSVTLCLNSQIQGHSSWNWTRENVWRQCDHLVKFVRREPTSHAGHRTRRNKTRQHHHYHHALEEHSPTSEWLSSVLSWLQPHSFSWPFFASSDWPCARRAAEVALAAAARCKQLRGEVSLIIINFTSWRRTKSDGSEWNAEPRELKIHLFILLGWNHVISASAQVMSHVRVKAIIHSDNRGRKTAPSNYN